MLRQALRGCLDALGELRRVEAAYRVLDDDELRRNAPCLGLRHDQRLERLGRHDDGGDALLLQFDAVVETPR